MKIDVDKTTYNKIMKRKQGELKYNFELIPNDHLNQLAQNSNNDVAVRLFVYLMSRATLSENRVIAFGVKWSDVVDMSKQFSTTDNSAEHALSDLATTYGAIRMPKELAEQVISAFGSLKEKLVNDASLEV